jgi:hypothetical protein
LLKPVLRREVVEGAERHGGCPGGTFTRWS